MNHILNVTLSSEMSLLNSLSASLLIMLQLTGFVSVPANRALCVPLQDPHLRNLESRFALQQKIVEAAMKLSNEGDLCKTVKKKRRNNCLDAARKLEEIENEINAYRIKKGKKPTQRASLILAGT